MKIVLLYLGRKGAGPIYSLEFTRSLLEQGVVVMGIISMYSDNIKDWNLLEEKYKSTNQFILIKVKTFQSKFQFILNTLNLFFFYQLLKRITMFHPDAILATMIHPWHEIIFSLLRKKILRIKIIHDVDPHVGERSFFKRMLSKWDIITSDEWIVLTQNSRNKLQEKGIDSNHILVIPHAHFGFYNHYSPPKINNSLNYRIGFFGRICKYKGVDNLLESYMQVVKSIPQLKLLVAGSGALDEIFIKRCNSINVELYNRWIEDDEVTSLLSKVDIVVLPYLDASQSGVIPLAFSLGKPVIVTNVGGLSEQVPSDCGLLVAPNSINQLTKSILYLYNHPNQIVEMGMNAYKYAYGFLNWDQSAILFISRFKKS